MARATKKIRAPEGGSRGSGRRRGAWAVPRRGRRYSEELKKECLKLLSEGMMQSAVAQLKGISTMSLYRWRKETEESEAGKAGRNKSGQGEVGGSRAEVGGERRPRAPHDNIAGLSDKEIEEILKLKKEHPSMGPAQIRAQLKRFRGWRIERKAIARALKAHGYRTEHRGAREEAELMRFEAPRPNALWQMDALLLRVHEHKLYLHLVLDDFSRFIVAHRLGEQPTSEEAVATLEAAIEKHGKPERVLTDRGGQFVAVRGQTAFGRFLEKELIEHSVSRPYHPQTIGKVESVNRALQKELINLQEFSSPDEARAAISAWVERYNFHRAHMGIDGLVPADRYFGLHRQVLAEVQARSRGRQAVANLDAPIGSPVEDMSQVMEVLRLVLLGDRVELRFCGTRVDLGKAAS